MAVYMIGPSQSIERDWTARMNLSKDKALPLLGTGTTWMALVFVETIFRPPPRLVLLDLYMYT